MASWKKMTLKDFILNENYKGKEIYIDDIGLCKISSVTIKINNYLISQLYTKRGKGHYQINKETFLNKFCNNDFIELYYNTNSYKPSYNKIQYEDIRFVFQVNTIASFNNNEKKVYFNFNTISYEKKIPLTDVDLDLQIYINNGDSYWPCAMSNDELKDKMNVYIFKYGTCKIDKVYPYPYSNGFKCKILTGNEKSENISLDTPIYYLPYKRQPKPQINIFNESFNEDLLMPIKVCDSNQNLINLYWKEVENASDYIIEIYKIFILKDGIRSIYHLESVEINKNQKYYSSTNFVRDNIVFVVKAEDKNGNIMAQSRGILNEKPKNWD